MKTSRIKTTLAAALLLAGGIFADAQSNRIPGNSDYGQFSGFISDRNIFNPNRYPPTSNSRSRNNNRPTKRPRSAGEPEFTLVGTMAYDKGMFAFFDGNSSDLKRILALDGDVAGYTVKDITLTSVKVEGPDKKEFQMKVGDQMRQDSGRWEFFPQSEAGQTDSGNSRPTDTSAAASDNSTASEPEVAPSASLQSNDILKRLMEKRAKADQ